MAAAQIADRALDRRQHLLVGDRQPVLAQAPRDRGGADVAAVREHDERAGPRRGSARAPRPRRARACARPSLPRCTSVPSTSNMKPRDVVEAQAVHATSPHHASRRPSLSVSSEIAGRSRQLLQQRDERRAAGARRGQRPRAVAGAVVARRDHRVDLLLGHRQPQQQLLLGDPLAEALARAVERQRLQIAELARLRARRAPGRRSAGRPARAARRSGRGSSGPSRRRRSPSARRRSRCARPGWR